MNLQIEGKLRKQGYDFLEMTSEKTGSAWDKPFHKWFWECVLGNSSEEYRREFWQEEYRGHTIGPSPKTFGRPDISAYSGLPYSGVVESDFMFRLVFLMIPGSFFWLLRHVLRRTLHKLRRPSYYERERDRRIELGRQRRSITMRTTVNARPSFDDIRAAWNGERHTPEGALRLGGLMEDLECFVCNLTIGNAIDGYRGRHGGIKRLLQDKAPDLFDHYTSLMRYKSIARRFRQACGLRDPEPVDAVLPLSSPPRKGNVRKNWSEQISRAKGAQSVATAGEGKARKNWSEPILRKDGAMANGEWKKADAREAKEVVKPYSGVKSWVLDGFVFGYKKGCWLEKESFEAAVRVLKECENSVISLEAALALEIDPNCVTAEFKQSDLKRERSMRSDAEKRTKGEAECHGTNKAGELPKDGTERWEKKVAEKCSTYVEGGENVKIGPNKSRIGRKQVAGQGVEKIGPNKSRIGRKQVAGQGVEKIGPNESRTWSKHGGDGRKGDVSHRVLNWLSRRSIA